MHVDLPVRRPAVSASFSLVCPYVCVLVPCSGILDFSALSTPGLVWIVAASGRVADNPEPVDSCAAFARGLVGKWHCILRGIDH